MEDFSDILLDWYARCGRDLPWRRTRDPYRIWLSEVILQQTRVAQGLDYYRRFVERFPDVQALAAASEDEVLKLWQGLDVGWCGTFGNVVTLGAGAVPVQLYYLHRAGLPLGPGAGLMTLEYVFHKSTVLLYATVMLLLQHRWLAANTTGVMRYLPMAYAVVAVIIVALVLLCVSPLVQNLARWLLGFLPKTEKWQQRRADWLEQLEVLGTESRRLLADKPRCLKIFALQALKLFGLFCLPYLCIRFMGLSPLGFWQVQLLTSLMLFVSNALPNVAGMGSIETAFLLVFGSFLERGEVMSVLMLYRIASYYVVFAASAAGFFIAQRHLAQMEPSKEG